MPGTRGLGRATAPRLLAAATTAACVLSAAAGASAATVGGGALGVKADVDVLGLVPANVGPAPSVTLPADGGGPITARLLSTKLLGLVTADVAKVSTQGAADPGSADSSAVVVDADVAGLVKVKVARSSCSANASAATGNATVVGLVVAGISIATVDLGPNTTISLPVGTVIVNEQTAAAGTRSRAARRSARTRSRSARRGAARDSARTRSRSARRGAARRAAAASTGITVNAVHVKLDALGLAKGDVVLAQSRCSVG